MGKIKIPVMDSTRETEAYLQSQVDGDEPGEFVKALDRDVESIDSRAYHYGTRITDVHIDGDTISVSYAVDYNIYNGCRDMEVDDSIEECAVGVRAGNFWEFDEFVPRPRRSTLDEF